MDKLFNQDKNIRRCLFLIQSVTEYKNYQISMYRKYSEAVKQQEDEIELLMKEENVKEYLDLYEETLQFDKQYPNDFNEYREILNVFSKFQYDIRCKSRVYFFTGTEDYTYLTDQSEKTYYIYVRLEDPNEKLALPKLYHDMFETENIVIVPKPGQFKRDFYDKIRVEYLKTCMFKSTEAAIKKMKNISSKHSKK